MLYAMLYTMLVLLMIIGIMVLVFPGKWMVVAYGSPVAWVSQNKLETGFKPSKHELYLFNRKKRERKDREKETRERKDKREKKSNF